MPKWALILMPKWLVSIMGDRCTNLISRTFNGYIRTSFRYERMPVPLTQISPDGTMITEHHDH